MIKYSSHYYHSHFMFYFQFNQFTEDIKKKHTHYKKCAYHVKLISVNFSTIKKLMDIKYISANTQPFIIHIITPHSTSQSTKLSHSLV